MDYREFRCRWINKNDLWDRAEQLRGKYWPEGILPVETDKIVEIRLRLSIEPIHGLLSLLDMDAYLKTDLSGIVVDHDCYMQEKFANRLRFSLAHELGHYFLHKDVYSNLPFGEPEDWENYIENWKNFIDNVPESEYSNFEWQADEFAGRFLVPRDILIKEVEKAIDKIHQNNLMEFLKQEPDAVLARIAPMLRKSFGVSEQVIKIRVQREKLWPPEIP